jgi:tripartite motif-containing protein 71
MFDEKGSFIRAFEKNKNAELSAPHDVAIHHSSNRVVVSDRGNHQIYIFNRSNGKILYQFGALGFKEGSLCGPRGLAIDGDDHIVVCDTQNHRLQVFDMNGNFLKTFGSEGTDKCQFILPTAVCVNEKGHYIVLDSGNKRIQVLNPKTNEWSFRLGPNIKPANWSNN